VNAKQPGALKRACRPIRVKPPTSRSCLAVAQDDDYSSSDPPRALGQGYTTPHSGRHSDVKLATGRPSSPPRRPPYGRCKVLANNLRFGRHLTPSARPHAAPGTYHRHRHPTHGTTPPASAAPRGPARLRKHDMVVSFRTSGSPRTGSVLLHARPRANPAISRPKHSA